ncbi:MAG: hypothetical protein CFE37_03885 [Alphaproteobacteria bacterium PA4]|nr:MAG: hypothetical protein CFE37_03885 [Alphaproteobacteria bacterium PA4]
MASLLLATASPPPAMLPRGTPVRVMVLNEVSSRSARAGDGFVILVDAPVRLGERIVIPAGTRGTGTVIESIPSTIGGKAGRLSARVGTLTLGNRSIAISGAFGTAGPSTRAPAALAATAASPLTPLARGNNAVLKAGDILDAELAEDVAF